MLKLAFDICAVALIGTVMTSLGYTSVAIKLYVARTVSPASQLIPGLLNFGALQVKVTSPEHRGPDKYSTSGTRSTIYIEQRDQQQSIKGYNNDTTSTVSLISRAIQK